MRYIAKGNSPQTFEDWKAAEDIDRKIKDGSNTAKMLWSLLRGKPKDALRRALLAEQGYICCYCGCLLKDDHNTTIEHLAPKTNHRKKMFRYDNLLACCMGGSKPIVYRVNTRETLHTIARKHKVAEEDIVSNNPNVDFNNLRDGVKLVIYVQTDKKYCGFKKGDTSIAIDPLQNDCETKFAFEKDGEMMPSAIGKAAAKDTITTLGLNDVKAIKNARTQAMKKGANLIDYLAQRQHPADRRQIINELIAQYNSKQADGTFRPYCFAIVYHLRSLLPKQ